MAEPAAAQDQRGRGQAYTLAFHDAVISQVAEEILGNTLGLTYTIDPEVTGKMSFRIDQRLTRAQLLEAFEAALAANGVVMVRDGSSLSLTPRAKAKTAAGLAVPDGRGPAGGYEVVAETLTYATPSEVGKALQAMGQPDIVVYADDKLGLLLLGGTTRELEAARQTLRVLDQSGLQSSKIRWFELSQTTTQTVSRELQQVLQASGAAGVTLVPLTRLNGILVVARTPRALDEAGEWINRLDVTGKGESQGLWFYRPRSLAAEALASTLEAALGGQSQAAGSQAAAPEPPLGASAPGSRPSQTPSASVPAGPANTSGDSNMRIGVNRESNTLVISAPASTWIQIKKILDQIDRTPDQVLIEASILEVTLGDEFALGVDWSLVSQSGKLTVTSSHNKGGAIGPTFPGFAVTYIDSDIQAAVSALKAVTDVEVVSAPKLMTIDNHTARLKVGDQVPITVQTAQSTTTNGAPLVATTEYRDTGVILDVTPRINGEDQITLDVDQQVSSVAKTTSSGIDSPTIQQRRIQSTLVLKDGATVALGGLISTSKSKGRSGLPIAKDIPLFGAAFRSARVESHRTELIVLITAKIMKDSGSSERLVDDLLADMREIQSRGLVKH
jgi:general secretion pathway protein D